MAAIHDLIAQVADERLRERLAAEWARATRERKFGLVFEDHLPELLPLPKARPRKGDLVAPRGGPLQDLWRVRGTKDGRLQCLRPQAEGNSGAAAAAAEAEFDPAEVVVVREFGEPVFPALVPVDAVSNGGPDAPWHTLIEADNYHALQLLEYLYAGKVDCIYIDPPYNTGARDWKYNNDYVDGNDAWRHSKWLAFMEKRLALARRLLNPVESVLIVTIDEKEYLRLGLLLAQRFPEAEIQMVSAVINRAGSSRSGRFSRVDEYIFGSSEFRVGYRA
jgi:adenine-specific DNA-methyltransferase